VTGSSGFWFGDSFQTGGATFSLSGPRPSFAGIGAAGGGTGPGDREPGSAGRDYRLKSVSSLREWLARTRCGEPSGFGANCCRDVLGHVRDDVEVAEILDKVRRVEGLVGTERQAASAVPTAEFLTMASGGYAISQRLRKRIEEIFGWLKAIGGGRKLRYREVRRNQLWADMATAAFNLVRIGNLMAEAA